MKRWTVWVLAPLALGTGGGAVATNNFPGSKAITLVVPFAAGGPTDRVARDLADAMRKPLGGATIQIENMVGMAGTLGAHRVARASNDGHTLLLWHIGMATAPALYRRLPFKPEEDFEYLGLVNEVPMTLIGRANFPAQGYRDFEKYIYAHAPQLSLAHAGLGSASHICGLMWQSALQLPHPLSTVGFGGTGPAMASLVGGQVDVMCDQTTNTTSQIEAGQVKAFAVTSARRLASPPLLKSYPTLQEMGLKGVVLTIWHGLYAPKGTPEAVLNTLNQALQAALKNPDFIQKQHALGAIVIRDRRIERNGHKVFVAAETARLTPVIEAAGKFAD